MPEGLPPPEIYLAPSFNPQTLKVSQLRGLLLSHSIPTPSIALKPALVELFTREVLSRREEWVDELEERRSVVASEEGIEVVGEDGELEVVKVKGKKTGTGRGKGKKNLLEVETEEAPQQRRVTRRSVSATPAPPTAKPPKATKSGVGGGGGNKGKRGVIKFEDVDEQDEESVRAIDLSSQSDIASSHPDSEPESDYDHPRPSSLATPRTGKKIRTAAAPSLTPRVVKKELEEESGFSDYNPFQSGGEEGKGKGRRMTVGGSSNKSALDAENATPTTPTNRKSLLGKEGRRTTLAGAGSTTGHAGAASSERGHGLPPAAIGTGYDPPAPVAAAYGNTSPVHRSPLKQSAVVITPRSGVAHEGTEAIRRTPPSLKKIVPERKVLRSPPAEWVESRQREVYGVRDEEEEDVVQYREEEAIAELEMETALEGGVPSLDAKPMRETGLTLARIAWAIPLIGVALSGLYLLTEHRDLSREIGFCDNASDSNSFTRQHQLRLQRDADCESSRVRAMEEDRPIPVCESTAWYHPTTCAPCPDFAICTGGKLVECVEERVPSAHALGFLNPYLDGAPYFGPVAFPPTCERNLTQDNVILNYAMGIEAYLAKQKGQRICAEGLFADERKRNEEDAIKYGVIQEELSRSFWDVDTHGETGIKRIIDGALNDLLINDEVFKQFGPGGKAYYASRRTTRPLSCKARMALVRSVRKRSRGITVTLATILTGLALLSWNRRRRETATRVKELVTIALDRLQDQRYKHSLDPTGATPFLLPSQLRDFVLADTLDHQVRQGMWESRVRPVVEKNANVRAEEREVAGDNWLCWEWIGVSKADDVDRQPERIRPVA